MPQSELSPQHTAIIMDGNGRWANARGLPRSAGHWAGARSVRKVLEAAPRLGIRTLTLYAFSSDNWNRPKQEVDALMDLLAQQLTDEGEHCARKGVRLNLIGRRDRLPGSVRSAAEYAEKATEQCARLHLRLAIDYSARDAILSAAKNAEEPTRECVSRRMGSDVDLLIRTGGEQRLSDFLLWECAYAELVFTPRLWPDFAAADLQLAVEQFRLRERRFGSVPSASLGQSWIPNGTGTVRDVRGDRWLR